MSHLAYWIALRARLRCGAEHEWSRYSEQRILCHRRRNHKGLHCSMFGVQW